MEYEWNEKAERIGERFISEVHRHLQGVKVAYLFKQSPDYDNPKRHIKTKRVRYGKKVVLAKARLVSKVYEDLLQQNFKFIIEFDRDMWDVLNSDRHQALVDHVAAGAEIPQPEQSELVLV